MPNTAIAKRACGPCTACCKPWSVPEVGKLDATWCQFRIAGKGCSIYPDRPPACRLFECLWKQGQGDVNDRPDKLGVILVGANHTIGLRTITTLVVWEMDEGAILKPRVQYIINFALSLPEMVVALMRPTKTGYERELLSQPNLLNPSEWKALQKSLS